MAEIARVAAKERHISVFDKTFPRNCDAWLAARKEGWTAETVGIIQNPDGTWIIRPLATHRDEIEADLLRRRSEQGSRHSDAMRSADDAQVSEIRRLHAAGHKQIYIARRLGLGRSLVRNVIIGRLKCYVAGDREPMHGKPQVQLNLVDIPEAAD